MPNNDDLDPVKGWVSVQEIHNLRVEFLRKLDNDVFPLGEHWRSIQGRCIKVFETFVYELYARSRKNYQDYLAGEKLKPLASNTDSRDEYFKRKETLKNR